MRLMIHDLTQKEWEALGVPAEKETVVIGKESKLSYCNGCFGCWLKTPGRCLIMDEYQKVGELLSKVTDLVLVSRCTFGGYSSFVKGILERTNAYLLPFLQVRGGKMRQKPRYKNHLQIKAVFYGSGMTEQEKMTAVKLVNVNAVYLSGQVEEIFFFNEKEEIAEVLR